MTTILFRLDAGRGIGLGHLQRCLSLATALRRRSCHVEFAVHGEDVPSPWLEEAGVDWTRLDADATAAQDAAAFATLAQRRGASALVVDTYRANKTYLERLCEPAIPVVSIDDFAAFAFPNHLVVNPTPYAQALPFASATGKTRFLLGPSYALLRDGFQGLSPRTTRPDAKHVLVTVGGTDGRNLTADILGLLDQVPEEFEVTVLVGPHHAAVPEIQSVAAKVRRRARIIRGTREPYRLMIEADVAVSAGGQTLYELAATGTPTIALAVAENQSRNASSFEQAGSLIALTPDRPEWRRRLVEELGGLLQNTPRRRSMAEAGQRLVDGGGAARVAAGIMGLVERPWN